MGLKYKINFGLPSLEKVGNEFRLRKKGEFDPQVAQVTVGFKAFFGSKSFT
ncbi:MAG: hypothetical protein WBM83_14435 [Flavobacteriaceae bacterium]